MTMRAPSAGRADGRLSELRARLMEAEDTLDAIRSGSVDALVVRTPRGERLFTLKGADQTYRALVEAMSEGAVTLQNGVVSYCNNHFAKMAQAPLEKVFGSSIFEFLPCEGFRRMVSRLQKGAQIRGSMEAVLRTRQGEQVPVQLSGSRYYADNRAAIGLVVTDIAERKEAERIRQELSRSIMMAQESERQRVARDLHDGVNQLLASAKYRLYGVTRGKNNGLLDVFKLVDKAIGEVRLISQNLRPGELDDLGLEVALRTLALEFRKRSQIAVRFKKIHGAGLKELPKDMEMTLYRIVQEALNNVEKHSNASRVEISFTALAGELILVVRDDGRGFVRGKRKGCGLQNMAERAAMLRGEFAVSSIPGAGTKITVRIPFFKSGRQAR